MSDSFRDRLRRLFEGRPPMQATPSECPLPDCSTCQPEPAPLDVVAEQELARDLAYTHAWLVEHYPDEWYHADTDKLRAFASGILALKLDLLAGKVTR